MIQRERNRTNDKNEHRKLTKQAEINLPQQNLRKGKLLLTGTTNIFTQRKPHQRRQPFQVKQLLACIHALNSQCLDTYSNTGKLFRKGKLIKSTSTNISV